MAERVVGTVGLFDDPQALKRAAWAIRNAGFSRFDCHTPYPVHGLDEAMGLGESRLGAYALAVGGLGAAAGLLMQWWMSAVDYPVNMGGKPLFSWPAFIPITFELFVLSAALATAVLLVKFCRLWTWHSPLHDTGVMALVTRDKFALVALAEDPRYDAERVAALLRDAGCTDVRPLVERVEEGEG